MICLCHFDNDIYICFIFIVNLFLKFFGQLFSSNFLGTIFLFKNKKYFNTFYISLIYNYKLKIFYCFRKFLIKLKIDKQIIIGVVG